jgi:transcriptional regulator with XRE-family HTH domain
MGDPDLTQSANFATLLRETRRLRGMTQDELIDRSGISRSTVLRWEKETPGSINVEQVRQLCATLDLDPREAVIALGFVTREEMGLPPRPLGLPPALQHAMSLLGDRNIPEGAKTKLLEHLRSAVEFWYEQLGVRRPRREPSAEERAGIRPVPARG